MNKRQLRLQLTFVYTIMVLAVLSIVAVLVLVIQGYRYNSYDGKLEQGGLVQFDSQPTGANVTVDSVTLANKTSSRIVLTAGDHHITLARDGYNSWQKDVTVHPGKVLWLNYALLYPTQPTVNTVAKFATASSALTSPNRHTMAIIGNSESPRISLATLNNATPTVRTVTLPDTAYTAPDDGTAQAFRLIEWDKDSHLLLVRHDVNGMQEYLSVDTRDMSRTVNISSALGVAATSAMYALNDTNTVYILNEAHELRRANIADSTVSGPLASNVGSFRVTEPNVIMYETLPDESGQRIVGYVSSGSTKAKVLSSYSGLGKGVLMASSGIYYGDHYVAIAHGATLDIMRGNLMSSGNNDMPALQHIAEVALPEGMRYIGFTSEDSRMVYAAGGNKVLVYDLELDASSTVNLAAPLTRQPDWINGYHLASAGGAGYYYDFDGTNGQLFAPSTVDLPIALDSSERYLYYFAKDGDGVMLHQIKLRVS